MIKRLPLVGSVLTSFLILAMVGCVSWSSEDEDIQELPELDGTVWQVEDVDNGGVIDNSMLTVAFNEGQISGFTNCNRYSGNYEIVGSSITIRGLANTLRACAPAIAAQEQRFLRALRNANSLRMESDIWLRMLDDKNMPRLKMIEIEEDPTASQPSSGE